MKRNLGVCMQKGSLIGLERGKVEIKPYNPMWKHCFEEERNLLKALLEKDAVDIQHIGSTAIPGISAKPIIDIAVGVRELNDGLKHIEALEKHGYEFRGEAGIPGRLFFAKGSPDFRTHHLHMVEYNSEIWANHLLFRDYLKSHNDAVEEYRNLKKELAQKFQFDRVAYTDGKSDFIQGIIGRAKDDFLMYMKFNKYYVKRLTLGDENILQQLCTRCSDYYEVVEGRNPTQNAGHEILTMLPPNKDYKDKFVLGVFNQNSDLVGVIDVVKDYPDKGEWMIGLLMIDPMERCKGLGRSIHNGLIKWASKSKADKLRIGAAEDNYKSICFWSKLGYEEIKKVNIKLGDKDNVVVVMNYHIKESKRE